MRYKFYLDGVEISEPQGASDLLTTIKRDSTANGILTTQDAPLVFTDSGYDQLWNNLNNNSFCERINIKILCSQDEGSNYLDYFNGVIFVSQLRFNEKTKTVRAKIQDNSFDSKINSNKSIQANIYAGRSKNGAVIDPAPYVTVTLFDVATGTDIAITAGAGNEAQGRMYRIYDVLNFFVAFMTDAEMDFASSYFDAGGEFEGLCLSSGYMVKGYNGVTPESDFNELFPKLTYQSILTNLKPLNLFFAIENADTRPTLRIEKKSYFEDSSTVVLSLDNLEQIETYISESDIYSGVKFGSNGLMDSIAYNFPEDINLVGFKNEEYHTLGLCNIDNTQDLSTGWVTSSNAIQEAIDRANLSQMSDTDVVLINCTPVISGSTYSATKRNWLTGASSPLFYNEQLNNLNTSLRHTGYIPNSIALFVGDSANEFLSKSSVNTGWQYNTPNFIFPVPFQIELSDPDSIYNPATYEFTAPASGVFSFAISLELILSPAPFFSTSGIVFTPSIEVYDSGGIFAYSIPCGSTGFSYIGLSSVTLSVSSAVNMTSGYKARVKVSHTMANASETYQIKAGSTFGVTYSNTGGGIFQTYDPDDYPVLRHEFSSAITFSQFKAIKANPKASIEFYSDPTLIRKGLVEDIKFNNQTTKFILRSSKNLNQ